jgi:orotidine-5'-phosphate decarboxylase
MEFVQQLRAAQRRNASRLCVGLDPEAARLPGAWRGDPRRIFDFCAGIVRATRDLACAYKPQIAYFHAQRAEDQLERLIDFIHAETEGVPVVLDAKRGDIGATAQQYAKEAFERYRADALTLSPFMGYDSIEPYLQYEGRGLFLLCRTSNAGGADLQGLRLAAAGASGGEPGQPGDAPGEHLYERLARLAAGAWAARAGGAERLGLVVGATYPAEVARVRALAPQAPLLIPGIGAQGGDLQATVHAALGAGAGSPAAAPPVLINSARAILYASAGPDWAEAARAEAERTRVAIERAAQG